MYCNASQMLSVKSAWVIVLMRDLVRGTMREIASLNCSCSGGTVEIVQQRPETGV